MSRVLSAKQVAEYEEYGFVRIGQVLDDRSLEAMRQAEGVLRAECARSGRTQSGRTHFISQVCHLSETVRQFCTCGPQVAMATELVDPNICVWFNQFVTKFPDEGTRSSAFPWHQDNGYGSVDPPRNMTVWVALDDVDERNGCIWVKPGSHRLGLLEHRAPSAESWYLQVEVKGEEVAVPLKAGEAIAFTGLTVHSSKYNDTDKLRRAFFMEYAWADAWLGRFQVPVMGSQHSWVVRGRSTIWGNIEPVPKVG